MTVRNVGIEIQRKRGSAVVAGPLYGSGYFRNDSQVLLDSSYLLGQFLTKLCSSVPMPWQLLEALGPHGISDAGAS